MPTLTKALAALLLAGSTLGAAAADAPCRDDARKFCASVQPGGGRAVACLKEHEGELTPACKAALPTLERCREEVQTVCGNGKPRELRRCLRDNAAKLSPECRATRSAR
jgi:hypothetical protein